MKIIERRVPGTCRQRVITNNGAELERQWVYLDRNTWNSLRRLAAVQGASGSVVISQLIKVASRYNDQIHPHQK